MVQRNQRFLPLVFLTAKADSAPGKGCGEGTAGASSGSPGRAAGAHTAQSAALPPAFALCRGRERNLLAVAYLRIRRCIDMDICEQIELVYSLFEFLSARITHLFLNNPGYWILKAFLWLRKSLLHKMLAEDAQRALGRIGLVPTRLLWPLTSARQTCSLIRCGLAHFLIIFF